MAVGLDEIKYPIRIVDVEGEQFYEDEKDLCCNLEWFDSSDPLEEAAAFDADGYPLLLVIKNLIIVTCERIDKGD